MRIRGDETGESREYTIRGVYIVSTLDMLWEWFCWVSEVELRGVVGGRLPVSEWRLAV